MLDPVRVLEVTDGRDRLAAEFVGFPHRVYERALLPPGGDACPR